MKEMRLRLIVIAVMLFFGSSAVASVKVAYVDMQRALQATSSGKKAKAELEKEFKKRKADLQKEEQDLKKLSEDLEKKKDLLSDLARRQKAAEFQQKMLVFRDRMQKSQLELNKRERQMTTPILKQLGSVIQNLAKKGGYDMIFEKSQQGIVWGKKELDITDQVVKAYEKVAKKK